ncbi:conserved hypothetical protein [Rippkaea orientalis PCC 8801]|uniref:DUF3750 domain-containing protein n=1 Tax=Rippkaea orientalis (strain PCC 8801 / RF-1) TaxID=41431 RepID=B7JW03_RIPO1|nr:DUF3750 domain-containing protein [Rippkaea orientalis]ACK65692.1 conserved hypothetical protein [Rippkaea orientalis PCC 8801]
METIVELRAAKIPFIGFIAFHYWYVVIREEQQDRWEIWQKPALSPESWGHLHKNLMSPVSGVGNGQSWLETSWTGQLGHELGKIIENSPMIYPYNDFYRYFPGPNSNTYVQWILNQANCNYRLKIKAIGKDY